MEKKEQLLSDKDRSTSSSEIGSSDNNSLFLSNLPSSDHGIVGNANTRNFNDRSAALLVPLFYGFVAKITDTDNCETKFFYEQVDDFKNSFVEQWTRSLGDIISPLASFSWPTLDRFLFLNAKSQDDIDEHESLQGFALRKICNTDAALKLGFLTEICKQYIKKDKLSRTETNFDSLLRATDSYQNNVLHCLCQNIALRVKFQQDFGDGWKVYHELVNKSPGIELICNEFNQTALEIVEEQGISLDEQVFYAIES